MGRNSGLSVTDCGWMAGAVGDRHASPALTVANHMKPARWLTEEGG